MLAPHRYPWPARLPFTVPGFPHRRVSRLPVDEVAFDSDGNHVTLPIRAFFCLPGARTVA